MTHLNFPYYSLYFIFSYFLIASPPLADTQRRLPAPRHIVKDPLVLAVVQTRGPDSFTQTQRRLNLEVSRGRCGHRASVLLGRVAEGRVVAGGPCWVSRAAWQWEPLCKLPILSSSYSSINLSTIELVKRILLSKVENPTQH